MKTYIIGAGATGCYFGGLLAHSGVPVTFVARGETYTALKNSGLTIKSLKTEFTIENVSVVERIADIRDPELILIFTKTYSLEGVCESLSKVVTPKTIVVTFPTGLQNDLIIKRSVPTENVYPGLLYVNALVRAPGVVEQVSEMETLLFGPRAGQEGGNLLPIELMFKSAGINATLTQDIEKEMWKKLVRISTYAGMSVLFRTPIGEIVNSSEGEALFLRCRDECLAIAASRGVEFLGADRAEIVNALVFYKDKGKNAKASMQLDIENRRRTEIETMHGELVRFARDASLDIPVLETIYAVVRVYENSLVN